MKRYRDFNTYLRSIFQERVQKIIIDAGLTCPNRDGTLSRKGCLYCNSRGSGSGAHARGISIKSQAEQGIAAMKNRYKANKFIAYFQSYTNTYTSCEHMREMFDQALSCEGFVGLAIGTRPDCVDEKKLALIQSYAAKYHVWIEYGLQSCHDATLKTINRGHDFKTFQTAVEMTKNRNINICTHIILGLPGEDRQMMLETAKCIGQSGIQGVKIHLLYVVKGSDLEQMWKRGDYRCMTQQAYVNTVCDVVEVLPQDIVIQRITGDPHPEELAAPQWSTEKSQTRQMIHQTLEKRDAFQGAKSQKSPENPLE